MARHRWFQFSLKSLMAAVVVLGLAFVRLEKYLSERPIDWEPFSRALLEEKLVAGLSVLVYFRADWDTDSFLAEKTVLETPEMRRAVRSNRVVALRADCSRSSKDCNWARDMLHLQPTTLVLFRSGQREIQPTVIRSLFDKGKAVEEIHKAIRQQPGST
jgi:hypothetical protein